MTAPTFEQLVAEADEADVTGWDFSWLAGRATEERPSWGYQRILATRLGAATAALDIQTGGGEVLAGAAPFPDVMAATESWAPNLARATALLQPLGAVVVHDEDQPPLPFADGAFDLVTSRHPVTVWWAEIARVLRPGGSYVSQQVGPESAFELIEEFIGPLSDEARRARNPDDAVVAARAAGLEVVDVRSERLRMELADVGTVVYLLRKLPWWVPGFRTEDHRTTLRRLDSSMREHGPFVAHSTRFLIEARRPE